MGKIIDFEATKPQTNEGEGVVFLANTDEMKAFGHKMVAAMGEFGLTAQQIEGLTDSVLAYISQCRRDAFRQGYNLGLEFRGYPGGGA